MISKSYLVNVYTGTLSTGKAADHFILIPDGSGSQEQVMSWMKPRIGSGVLGKPLRQLDGSILQTYRPAKGTDRGFWTMFEAMRQAAPRGMSIVPEDVFRTYTQLTAFTYGEMFFEGQSDWDYWLYELHRFENGSRYIPLAVHRNENRCYNLSSLFKHSIPEDEMGVFLEKGLRGEKEFRLAGLPSPSVRTFLSNIRLCPTCFQVHDITKPAKRPWLHYRWKKIKSEYSL